MFIQPTTGAPIDLRDDFSTGSHGWAGGFADYPVGDDSFYQLSWGLEVLPVGSGQGLSITGNNHSDDLFMYFTKRVVGLSPGATYAVTMDVLYLTSASEHSVGIGGSPGASVYLKAGVVSEQPGRMTDKLNWWRMNIDKGNQSQGGSDAMVLGIIGHPFYDFNWHPIQRKSKDDLLYATANDQGELWLLFGTDSGFEGTTELYYTDANFSLMPVSVPEPMGMMVLGMLVCRRRGE